MVFSLFRPKDQPFEPVLTPKPRAAEPDDGHSAEVMKLSRKERVARAFEDMPLDARETEAICALLDKPGSTSVELSRACGWMDTAWRAQMLMLCQRRRKYLWPEGISHDVTNGIIITALAEYDSYTLRFTPRKDVIRSLTKAVKNAL
jgi:hypothetical protein